MVGYLSINLCCADIAVSEHLAERFHRDSVGKANRSRECVASHVKGQAFLYPAYLPDVHTRKDAFLIVRLGNINSSDFLSLT